MTVMSLNPKKDRETPNAPLPSTFTRQKQSKLEENTSAHEKCYIVLTISKSTLKLSTFTGFSNYLYDPSSQKLGVSTLSSVQ